MSSVSAPIARDSRAGTLPAWRRGARPYLLVLPAQFAVAATVVETLLGIGVALLLARSSLVSRLLERLLIVPLMIAPVIAAIIWRLMMLPTVGVLNYLLSPFGIRPEWTGSPRWALFSIILVDVWTYTPFVAL